MFDNFERCILIENDNDFKPFSMKAVLNANANEKEKFIYPPIEECFESIEKIILID